MTNGKSHMTSGKWTSSFIRMGIRGKVETQNLASLLLRDDMSEAQFHHRHIAGLQGAALCRVGGRHENRALAFPFIAFGDDHSSAIELLSADGQFQAATLLAKFRSHDADFFGDSRSVLLTG